MSNVIDFLENMGRDARLRHASPSDVQLALDREQIQPELRGAILAGDQARLEALLGQQILYCMQFPAREDEEEETEEDPSRHDQEESMRSVVPALVSTG